MRPTPSIGPPSAPTPPDPRASAADDRELVARVRSGAEPFSTLVARYGERVFRLVVSILGPHREADAEEATQDVFVKVYRRLADFRGDSALATWLFRIAYRTAVDLRRADRPPPDELPAPVAGPDPEELVAASQRRRLLLAMVGELDDRYRSALYLHYWMGHTVEEIAALLEAPAGTVKSYLHRGRRQLHRLLIARRVDDEADLP